MHEVSQIGANQGEWHDRDLRRSIDFHALLLAMAGHDLRQNLQIILSTYGWLSARATSDVERECIASGQHAAMQMAEQLHQLATALHIIHQNSSQIALTPVRLGPLISAVDQDAARIRLVVTHDALDQGALAGAVFAEKRMDACWRDLERYAVQSNKFAEALRHRNGFDPESPACDRC